MSVALVQRHVIVTGGSRGLGLALVRDLLAAGYRVSTCARKPTAELDALASEGLHVAVCDIAEPEAVRRFVGDAAAWAGSGGMWGLVNNAGIAREGVLASFPETDIAAVIDTNLVGAMVAARAFLREKLVRRGPGRIINISSIIGQRGYTGLTAYSASKAGLDGFTRALAREVGRLGITVNSVAPGYLETEMSSTLEPGQRDQIVRRTPLGRLGRTQDIVPVIRFLLADDSAFLTGQTLTIDGGITT